MPRRPAEVGVSFEGTGSEGVAFKAEVAGVGALLRASLLAAFGLGLSCCSNIHISYMPLYLLEAKLKVSLRTIF